MPDYCVLCGYLLNDKARKYTEGLFCEDSAGCRRRAWADKMRYLIEIDRLKDQLKGAA